MFKDHFISKMCFVVFSLAIATGLTFIPGTTYAQTATPTPSATPTTETGIIAGTVVDSTTGVGIANATVSTDVGGYTATSDPTGNFAIFDVAPGAYTITASAIGYTSSSVTTEVLGGGTPTFVTITLASKGNGVIFGFVNDIDEEAFPGIRVTIEGADFADSTITDEDGYYEFTHLGAGDYTITYELEGYQTQTQYATIGENEVQEIDTVIMEIIQKGYISGNVADLKGNPVDGAKLSIKGIKTKFRAVVISDEDGFFEFGDLEADTYVIIARKKGYKRAKQTASIGEGEEVDIEITMKKTVRK